MCVCVCVCVCKDDLALNNLQWLICHKTKPNLAAMVYNTNLLAFDIGLIILGNVCVQLLCFNQWVNSRTGCFFFNFGMATGLEEEKF